MNRSNANESHKMLHAGQAREVWFVVKKVCDVARHEQGWAQDMSAWPCAKDRWRTESWYKKGRTIFSLIAVPEGCLKQGGRKGSETFPRLKFAGIQ